MSNLFGVRQPDGLETCPVVYTTGLTSGCITDKTAPIATALQCSQLLRCLRCSRVVYIAVSLLLKGGVYCRVFAAQGWCILPCLCCSRVVYIAVSLLLKGGV